MEPLKLKIRETNHIIYFSHFYRTFNKFYSTNSQQQILNNKFYSTIMVKNTSRDTRTMKRDTLRLRNELSETKRKAETFRKMVFQARGVYMNRLHCVQTENKILIQSLKKFNKICNQQKQALQQEKRESAKLLKTARELQLLKHALKSIRTVSKLRREACI